MKAKPPISNWTTANLESLSGSQVKALLRVASESPLGDVEHLLGEHADLLSTAMEQTTPVQELTRIKNVAKVLIENAEDGARREAARLLYHASVAAAFVRHGATISGRPMQKQQPVYEGLAAAWGGSAIGRLFAEAAARVSATIPRG
jgi:hypothetical protein